MQWPLDSGDAAPCATCRASGSAHAPLLMCPCCGRLFCSAHCHEAAKHRAFSSDERELWALLGEKMAREHERVKRADLPRLDDAEFVGAPLPHRGDSRLPDFDSIKETRKIINEFATTEQSYNVTLQEITRLKQDAVRNYGQDRAEEFFSNVDVIEHLSTVLLREFTRINIAVNATPSGDAEPIVKNAIAMAQLFLQIVPAFQIYIPYMATYAYRVNKISAFQKTREGALLAPRAPGAHSIDSLLITIVQRLPRYEMLLNTLSKQMGKYDVIEKRRAQGHVIRRVESSSGVGTRATGATTLLRAHASEPNLTMPASAGVTLLGSALAKLRSLLHIVEVVQRIETDFVEHALAPFRVQMSKERAARMRIIEKTAGALAIFASSLSGHKPCDITELLNKSKWAASYGPQSLIVLPSIAQLMRDMSNSTSVPKIREKLEIERILAQFVRPKPTPLTEWNLVKALTTLVEALRLPKMLSYWALVREAALYVGARQPRSIRNSFSILADALDNVSIACDNGQSVLGRCKQTCAQPK